MKTVFQCTCCGFCCRGETTVSLNQEDQTRMLEFLQISREEAMEKFWRISSGGVQMQVADGHCIFYTDAGCSVHPCRPWRCRQWPLIPAVLHDGGNLTTLRQSCPGIRSDASLEEFCQAVRRQERERPIMKYEILLLGKTKESFLGEGIEEYTNRLKHYAQIHVKTLKSQEN